MKDFGLNEMTASEIKLFFGIDKSFDNLQHSVASGGLHALTTGELKYVREVFKEKMQDCYGEYPYDIYQSYIDLIDAWFEVIKQSLK